jgi:hypothetical protein
MPWRNPATATEGIVWGRVTDANTGLYVDDATVTVTGGPTVRTDGNGYYVATLVPAAAGGTSHSMTVSKAGMSPQTTNAIALAGDIVRYDLTLNAEVKPMPAPPRIDSITLLSGGQVRLQVIADPGQYAIEASTSLTDWAELSNFTTSSNSFQYLDSETIQAQRYYRVHRIP